jgi:membrane protein YqaA with SNARE-associated domain
MWTALGCFALTLLSALVPWVNAEVIVLSLPAVAASGTELVLLLLVATAGQMSGKCVLYWIARRGGARLSEGRVAAAIARWRVRIERRPSSPVALVLLSSAVGIPPFYVITLMAGALRVGFWPFLAAGTCGRLVRFGALIYVPHLVVHAFR